MRDIGERIRRYRLSRYAAPRDPLRHGLRWMWAGLALWLLWGGLLSDHSLYRLWRLGQENDRARLELARVSREIARLDAEARDPRAMRELAERVLREKDGMVRPGEIVYRIRGPASDSLARE